MFWIREIDSATSVDYLRTSGSILGHHFPIFETLHAKIANALKKILATSDFRKNLFIEEQKAQNENRSLRGRHIAILISDYFRITGTSDSILDFSDLVGVTIL